MATSSPPAISTTLTDTTLVRRPVRLVTVALANKMARIAWALLTRNEVYRVQGCAEMAAGAAV